MGGNEHRLSLPSLSELFSIGMTSCSSSSDDVLATSGTTYSILKNGSIACGCQGRDACPLLLGAKKVIHSRTCPSASLVCCKCIHMKVNFQNWDHVVAIKLV